MDQYKILRQESGYTLIELLIVIVLLGILAAIALPKFSHMTMQAKTAANQSLAEALQSAVNIAHGAWLTAGSMTGGTTVTLDGTQIFFNINGWPVNSPGPLLGSNPSAAECANIWNNILDNPPIAQAHACQGDHCYIANSTDTTCIYKLSQNPHFTITYHFTTGQVLSSP